MSGLTYYSRLQVLGLESLETRRLCTDVLLVYRIMFGMVRLDSNEFITLRNQPHLRGHKCVINKQRCSNTGWAKKTGLFFRLDNFVTASPRKACSMSKFSQFYREKGTNLAFQ